MGFDELKSKLVKIGEDTKSSMQKMGETIQLTSKLSTEKKNLDGLFAQLGTAVFDKLQDAPMEGMEELFASISSAKAVVADLEEQVSRRKGTVVCTECGREAARGEAYCPACGAKLPEPPAAPESEEEPAGEAAQEDELNRSGCGEEAAEETGAKVKKDAAEVGREVGDLLNTAAEKARGFLEGVADKAGAFIDGVASQISKDKAEDGDFDDDPDEDFEEDGGEAPEEGAGEAQAAEEAAAEEPVKNADGMSAEA